MILGIVIQSSSSQMLLAMLFTVFVLYFSEHKLAYNVSDRFRKYVSFVIAMIAIIFFSWGLYMSFTMFWGDFNALLNSSQEKIISSLNSFGVDVKTIHDLSDRVLVFIKENTSFLIVSSSVIIKTFLGVILGIIIHFSPIERGDATAWGSVLNKIISQSKEFFNSFKTIMTVQVMISIMNTSIIAFMSTIFTWMIYDQFLPYWYVIIMLTTVLSMVPVVGNVIINLIIIFSTVQLSPEYVLVGIGLFLIIHKIELIVVGKGMHQKSGVPFVIILFSMVIGNLLFESMSGMILGMVGIVTIAALLKNLYPDSSNMLNNHGK